MTNYDSHKVFEQVLNCRTCNSGALEEVIDLGIHPLANSLVDSKNLVQITAPLVLIRCNDCTTLQLSVNVRPNLMFQQYLWVTGTTETAKNHCLNLAKEVVQKSQKINPVVLEIGSNDGTLLKSLIESGAGHAIGVDPAQNLQPRGLGDKILPIQGFFGFELASQIRKDLARVDVVVARNVLSHVPNLNDVMLGILELISDDGIIVIEFHEASKILTELHFESIYHEHTFYHSIRSIQAALSQIGFTIFDLSESPISGGSYVIYASRRAIASSTRLKQALEIENSTGVYLKSSWDEFARKVKENLDELRIMFELEKDSKWVAFGASARSSTLLNSVGDSSRCLAQIADNNSLKHGKLSPGLNLPIVDPREAINSSVEKIFICAFNFENEIIELLKDNLKWSGEVILPLPHRIRRFRV